MSLIAMLALLATLWAGEGNGHAERAPTRLYSPAQLVRMIQGEDPVVFLNVREPDEYAENHIPGAINIPRRDFAKRRSEIPGDVLVIPYCNMDLRGFVAIDQLEALGFERLGLTRERGINGWQAAGLPVVLPGRGQTDSQKRVELLRLDADALAEHRAVQRVVPTANVHRTQMEVAEWYFHPNDLRMAAGDRVEIELSSLEGDHYFILPDFEVQGVRVCWRDTHGLLRGRPLRYRQLWQLRAGRRGASGDEGSDPRGVTTHGESRACSARLVEGPANVEAAAS